MLGGGVGRWSLSTGCHSPSTIGAFPAGLLFASRMLARCVFLVRLPELELSVTMGWRNFGEGAVPWREIEFPIGERCVRTAQVQVQVQGGEGRKIGRLELGIQQAREPLRMQTGCQVVGLSLS